MSAVLVAITVFALVVSGGLLVLLWRRYRHERWVADQFKMERPRIWRRPC